ncbi:hypothetical protein DdX_19523 [Ditylenchus destructor]|uniref:Uncharacterized protein n=1 Tax=Ditylenchus destructor TaxID=166010 RepID=A0AAD4MMG7_9BILA|nr:hypothetical protein DdX_19523 [Ditylenchus destructor]
MYLSFYRKRSRPWQAQNGEQIASAQNEDEENEKAVANVHCKETTIPRWNPTENILQDMKANTHLRRPTAHTVQTRDAQLSGLPTWAIVGIEPGLADWKAEA